MKSKNIFSLCILNTKRKIYKRNPQKEINERRKTVEEEN